jgi:hypothetical protein
MKKIVGLILLTLVSFNSWSQEFPITLICSGRYDDFIRNIRNVEERGAPIYISKTTVKVHVTGFTYKDGDPLEFKIKSITDSKISFLFLSPDSKSYFGSLNRYTGDIGISVTDLNNSNQISQIFSGNCIASKRRF